MRLFKRSDCSGHQLSQHDLDNLFVMDEKLERVLDGDDVQLQTENGRGGRKGRIMNFMEMEVDPEMLETDKTVIVTGCGENQGQAANNEVLTTSEGRRQPKRFKVRDLSRLWLYRDGRTPEDWIYHGRTTW